MQSWDLFERKSCEYTTNISSSASSKNMTFLVSSLSSFAKNKQTKKLTSFKERMWSNVFFTRDTECHLSVHPEMSTQWKEC